MSPARAILLGALIVVGACGPDHDQAPQDATEDATDAVTEEITVDPEAWAQLPYAREVVSFEPGESAGYGQQDMPGVVLGPPRSRGVRSGSLHVVSLGVGGQIVLGFGPWRIEDGEGVDFVVFENAFAYNGGGVFSEFGEVSVSEDGQTWHTFECDPELAPPGPWPGCAGWRPTRAYDPLAIDPLDPDESGGDGFDLAQLGLSGARYVRIRDLALAGSGPTAGFDLDAVGIVHAQRVEPE